MRRIFDAARHPKSFVSLDGADHLLTRHEDAAFVAEVVSAWASRYVPLHRAEGKAVGCRRTPSCARTDEGLFQHVVMVGGGIGFSPTSRRATAASAVVPVLMISSRWPSALAPP